MTSKIKARFAQKCDQKWISFFFWWFLQKLNNDKYITCLRPVLKHILDQDLRPIFNQNEPICNQNDHQELQWASSKTLKNLEFLQVFDYTRHPKKLQ